MRAPSGVRGWKHGSSAEAGPGKPCPVARVSSDHFGRWRLRGTIGIRRPGVVDMRRTALVLAAAVVLLASCGWARPRFDDAKTGHNPLELSISRDNVATLGERFRAATPATGTPADLAVARGHLYASG